METTIALFLLALALLQSVPLSAAGTIFNGRLRGFSAPIDLRIWGPKEWALRESVTYTALDGREFVIPAWFIHDGASIPKWARALYGSDDELRWAALLHDWLYCSHLVSRADADALFLECLARTGAHFKLPRHRFWLKRHTIYSFVRLGGWWRWAQCATGPKVEDFAVSEMNATERQIWLGGTA